MSTTTETTTENVSPSTPAEVAQRVQEIQDDFEPVKAAHRKWQSVPGNDGPPPELVSVLMPRMAFNLLQRADFPQILAGSWAALNVWAAILVRVLKRDNEFVDASEMPRLLFWTKFNDLMHALNVKPPVRRVLPKLAQLMEDFGGDSRRDQFIANEFSIFDKDLGMKVGPFHTNGSPDSSKIQRELRNPGSVLDPEFNPEDGRVVELVEMEPANLGVLAELQRYFEESGQKKKEIQIDPETIENLLLQGMFAATIARVKCVSEKSVRQIAKKLRIKVTEPSDLFELADIHSDEDKIYRTSMIGDNSNRVESPAMDADETDDDTDFESGSDDEDESELEIESDDDEEFESDIDNKTPELSVDSVLQKLMDANMNIDTPRAMQAIKSAGLKATGPDIGRRLGIIRQAMTAAAADSES